MSILNRKYPHLLPPDIAVWERFLQRYPAKYIHIHYDIRVGDGRPADETYPKNIQRMALDLSCRRIDAVGITAGSIDIIEITPAIGFRALGQCLVYPLLYKEKFKTTGTVHTLVVAEVIGTDIECAVRNSQLHCELFPENGVHVSLNAPANW